MKFWLFNPFDPLPTKNQVRYSYLIKFLTKKGHSAIWWTSQYAHYGKRYIHKKEIQLENEALKPCGQIIPAWTTPYKSHSGIGRIINHFTWSLSVYISAAKNLIRPDIILMSSPPLTTVFLIKRLANKFKCPLILDVVDLWPEAFEILLPSDFKNIGKKLFTPLKTLETCNFKKADALTAVSKSYLENALSRSKNKPNMVVPYGIDLDKWPFMHKDLSRSNKEKIKICYAGTLGPHHDLITLVNAAKLLKYKKNIEFIIAGDGPLRFKLESLTRHFGLSNIVFTGWLDQDSLKQILYTCHIGILAVCQGSVISIPLKTFDYMASGLALLSSVKGELEQFIQENSLGSLYEPGNPVSLGKAVCELVSKPCKLFEMGLKARKLAEEEFDRKRIIEKLINFMIEVAQNYRN